MIWDTMTSGQSIDLLTFICWLLNSIDLPFSQLASQSSQSDGQPAALSRGDAAQSPPLSTNLEQNHPNSAPALNLSLSIDAPHLSQKVPIVGHPERLSVPRRAGVGGCQADPLLHRVSQLCLKSVDGWFGRVSE